MSDARTRTDRLRLAAEAEGFARMGVAKADRLEPESAQLDAWLEAGRHGQMAWMQSTADVRKDPRPFAEKCAEVKLNGERITV